MAPLPKTLEKFTAPIGTPVDRFISEKQEHFPYAKGELSQLLRDIVLASKVINREMNRAGLTEIRGHVGAENVQGEQQQKLDVIADYRFRMALQKGGETCAIASEEEEDIIDTQHYYSKYVVTIDPLDGSSNIDSNVSVGTIFSIYRRVSPIGTPPVKEDLLQKGSRQVAAGYVLYGTSTILVYTTGHGVNGFTYDGSLGEYFLSHPNITFPKESKFFSVNEGGSNTFDKKLSDFLQYCKDENYSGRYIGSLVGDFHRNLLNGGIYLYPESGQYKQGKLRLLYECNALAFLAEQAGGIATNGIERVLDIKPEALHERTPFFVGSKGLMQELADYLT
ncbi:class 1 fructose-bisphosphatase [Persicobacter diffluens]|uniref:Fructose-1,6-bisphosphatase class 1 n=1 Tax=Persicobacter diffluens TaxID=981 RepID=A0AAN5APX5_9BACT|nr:fructose-1,6-bisphosphatase class 1 [Persicobacter diffluens]